MKPKRKCVKRERKLIKKVRTPTITSKFKMLL